MSPSGRRRWPHASRDLIAVAAGTVLVSLLAWLVLPQSGDSSRGSGIAQKADPGKSSGANDDIAVTLVGDVTTSAADWKVAFPDSTPGTVIDHFLAPREAPDESVLNADFSAQLDVGAFAVGGLNLAVNLEGMNDREVTVRDIRIKDRRIEPMPVEATIFMVSMGGANEQIYVNLDESFPRMKTMKADGSLGGQFSKMRHLSLPRGGKEELVLRVDAAENAYSFEIEFVYEVAGQTKTFVLKRKNQPFRVAPNPCLEEYEAVSPAVKALSAADKTRISGIRYRKASVLLFARVPWTVGSVDPEKICDPV